MVITLAYPKKEEEEGKTVKQKDRVRLLIPATASPLRHPLDLLSKTIQRHLFRPETNSLGLMNPTV